MNELIQMYAKELPGIAAIVAVIYMFLRHNRQTNDGYQELIKQIFNSAGDRDDDE